MIKCPRCGYDNVDDAIYCVKCGYPLRIQQSSTSPQQPPYYSQPPYGQPHKRPLNKLIIPIAAVIVIIIAAVVIFPFLIHSGQPSAVLINSDKSSTVSTSSGPSSPILITPSKAVSVIGGCWSVNTAHTYSFTVSNGIVVEKYLNGSSKAESIQELYANGGEQIQGLTSGYYECLTGNADGQNSSLIAIYMNFSSSCDAKYFFSEYETEATLSASSHFDNISSNEFVVYTSDANNYECEYGSTIVVLSGNSIKIVGAALPNPLGTYQLESLVNSF